MKAPKKVGILGGGQLARMLILEGHRLGLEMHVLCSSPFEPAAQVASQVHIGTADSLDDINAFLKDLDAVTFESEFIDTRKLSQSAFSDMTIFPALPAIDAIQDRLTQKQLLDSHKIPTAPWMSVSNINELKKAAAKFKKGFVLKKRRFGYDGYGTFVIRKLTREHEKLLSESAHGFIAEELITFKRELATTVARSQSQTEFFPLVESKQVNSRCDWIKGPVKHKNMAPMQRGILWMMKALNYQGVLAIELFETTKGLLVNELAPRVHNSAHYSLEGLNLSQFEVHLRAGLNWQLPKLVPVQKGFAMVNLLGEGHAEVQLSAQGLGKLHWYGKLENKVGRKLGHITCLDSSADRALKKALKWRKDFVL